MGQTLSMTLQVPEPDSRPRRIEGAVLLEIWEQASAEPPLQRAVSIVHSGWPFLLRHQIDTMSVAERDARLLWLRAVTFGPDLALFGRCQTCDCQMEIMAPVRQLDAILGAIPPQRQSIHDGYALQVRLANTRDLVAALAAGPSASGRQIILSRCLQATDPAGNALPIEALPAPVLQKAEAEAEALHADAEIMLDFICPACGARQAIPLDIAQVFWLELRHAARRLLSEVHDLAWAYGWTEDAILTMSGRRRQTYLSQVWQ
jgi:hypothetical protein